MKAIFSTLLLLATLAVAVPAGAQASSTSDCMNAGPFIWNGVDTPAQVTVPLDTELPPGNIMVEVVTWDEYPGRTNTPAAGQTSERVRVDIGGSSLLTGDLYDGVEGHRLPHDDFTFESQSPLTEYTITHVPATGPDSVSVQVCVTRVGDLPVEPSPVDPEPEPELIPPLVIERPTRGDCVVSNLYRILLNREPDNGGLIYWKAHFDQGYAGIGDIAWAIAAGDEHRNHIARIGKLDFTYHLFRSTLQREPNYSEFMTWRFATYSHGKAGAADLFTRNLCP